MSTALAVAGHRAPSLAAVATHAASYGPSHAAPNARHCRSMLPANAPCAMCHHAHGTGLTCRNANVVHSHRANLPASYVPRTLANAPASAPAHEHLHDWMLVHLLPPRSTAAMGWCLHTFGRHSQQQQASIGRSLSSPLDSPTCAT